MYQFIQSNGFVDTTKSSHSANLSHSVHAPHPANSSGFNPVLHPANSSHLVHASIPVYAPYSHIQYAPVPYSHIRYASASHSYGQNELTTPANTNLDNILNTGEGNRLYHMAEEKIKQGEYENAAKTIKECKKFLKEKKAIVEITSEYTNNRQFRNNFDTLYIGKMNELGNLHSEILLHQMQQMSSAGIAKFVNEEDKLDNIAERISALEQGLYCYIYI